MVACRRVTYRFHSNALLTPLLFSLIWLVIVHGRLHDHLYIGSNDEVVYTSKTTDQANNTISVSERHTYYPLHEPALRDQHRLGSLGYANMHAPPAKYKMNAMKTFGWSIQVAPWNFVPHILRKSNIKTAPDDMSLPPHNAAGSMCPYPKNDADNLCNPGAIYRTYDGSCNNLQRPLNGKSFRPLQRFVTPQYGDGFGSPRVSKISSRSLPSARHVTNTLFRPVGNPPEHIALTTLVFMFGQFTDHDIGRTAISMTASGGDVMCGPSGCDTFGPDNEACLPIPIPANDPKFNFRTQPCLKFVRSMEAEGDDCSSQYRQQLNQVTSYLDLSQVYGSTVEDAFGLRDFSVLGRGRMLITANASPVLGHLLPQMPPQNAIPEECVAKPHERPCFMAGDTRVNEQAGLTSIHTVMVRLHNLIEGKFHALNPEWGGETLYQETRKLMGGIWQQVVYKELLPIIVGPDNMHRYGLHVLAAGSYYGYDVRVNAEAGNVFQAAAFRFGHTLIPDALNLQDSTFHSAAAIDLSRTFLNPQVVYSNDNPGGTGVSSLLFGAISQSAENNDNTFVTQILDHLFADNPPNGLGMDLPALNIQRARDHGIPGYNAWRSFCKLSVATSFEQLYDIAPSTRNLFNRLYSHVDDIDLFPAAMSETPVAGGLVGPTFSCIISQQFLNAKTGDRFWHENYHADPHIAFTDEQKAEIRKITLSRIFCETLDHINTIQPNPFLLPYSETLYNAEATGRVHEVYNLLYLYRGSSNARVPCAQIAHMDLTPWRDLRYARPVKRQQNSYQL